LLVEQELPVTLTYATPQVIELKTVGTKKPPIVAVSDASGICLHGDYCIHIRQSVADKNAADKPAQIQLTEPNGGSASWSTDVGMTLSVPPHLFWETNSLFEGGATFEYHRQTATDREQNALLAGLTASYLIGDVTSWSWSQFVESKVQYKDDHEKSAEGLQLLLDYIPVKPRGWFRIGRAMDLGGVFGKGRNEWLQLLVQPTFGFDYDGVYDAPQGKPTGDIGRFYANIETALYPAGGADLLGKRLEIFAQYSNWVILGASSGLRSSGDTQDFWTAGLRFYFDQGRHVGVGLSYYDGENPRTARPKQQFFQAALELRY